MNIPDEVLAAMADAMIDPLMRQGVVQNDNFRKERIRVLTRALVAAEDNGWVMRNTNDEADRT